MVPSFFDLQRYAKTGIASADMTAFDKMRALAAFGGGTVHTLTGIPPLSFKSDGSPLISWSMKGNGSQSGTPTPNNPVMPTFCGVRTGNLFDAATAYGSMYDSDTGVLVGAASTLTTIKNKFASSMIGVPVTISIRAHDVTVTRVCIRCTISGSNIDSNSIPNGKSGTVTVTVTPTSVNDDWRITYGTGSGDITLSNIMLNSGSVALSYEPYGYKIPITCAEQTTPIYLGEVPTVRRIKKLVLTGEENWSLWSSGQPDVERYYYKWGKSTPSDYGLICTHLPFITGDGNFEHIRLGGTYRDDLAIFISKTIAPTVADFKSYLAAQYAAGTPVTVWYILKTPGTGIVNEPLCKIGTYADELHSEDAEVTIPTAKGQNTLTVDTDLQPSEMSITGHIKAI